METTNEIQQLKNRIQELEHQIKDLQHRSISINLEPKEKENIKNALFEGFYQSDQAKQNPSASVPYLKVFWKNKEIFIPYYEN